MLLPLLFLGIINCLEYNKLVYKCNNEGEALLSFDGGPSSNNTAKLLSYLSKENITAAFFLTAANTASNQPLAKQILSQGHLLGYRFETEWNITAMTDEGLYNSIERSLDSIRSLVGRRPRMIRANDHCGENGGMSNALVTKMCYAGYSLVSSKVDGKDFNLTAIGSWPSPFQAVEAGLAKMGGSDSPIIQLHDTNWLSVNETRLIVDGVKAKGFKLVSASQCFGVDNFYQDEVSAKIPPFYGDIPNLKNHPEDEGKVFSAQSANSSPSLKSHLGHSIILFILLFLFT